MALGNQVQGQTRIKPVRSLIATAPGSSGVGIAYGMGAGSVRVGGISYSIYDASGTYLMTQQSFVARLVVINGDYSADATQFTILTDLTAYDLLFERFVQNAQDTIPTWFSGMATDLGENATLLISQLFFPAGAGPIGIQPVASIVLHADRYATRDLALSQGSIFEEYR